MKAIFSILAVSFVFASGQAAAAKAFGMAGCGLGNLAFGKESQVLAATTNGTSYSQWFGITSGTSNCVDTGAHAANRLPLFIEGNKVALANDIARGEGETITTLANVLGCEPSAALGSRLQADFGAIFPNASVSGEEAAKSVIDSVRADSSLASACSQVI